MDTKIDYVSLMSVAKENLSQKINIAQEKYRNEKTIERKNELINLIYERNKLFLFDKKIIEKYL